MKSIPLSQTLYETARVKPHFVRKSIRVYASFMFLSAFLWAGNSYAATCFDDSITGNFTVSILGGNNSSQVTQNFNISSTDSATAVWFVPVNEGTVTLTHISGAFDSVANLFEDSDGQLSNLQFVTSNDDGVSSFGGFRIEDTTVQANTRYCLEITEFSNSLGSFNGIIELDLDETIFLTNTELPACTADTTVAGYFNDLLNFSFIDTEARRKFASIGRIDVQTAGSLFFLDDDIVGNNPVEIESITISPENNPNIITNIDRGQSQRLETNLYCAYIELTDEAAIDPTQLSLLLDYAPTENIYDSLEIIWGENAQFAENAGTIELGVRHSETVSRVIPITIELGASTATEELDYLLPERFAQIPEGGIDVRIPIELINDSVQEQDEQIQLTLLDNDGFQFASTTLVINDDDAPVMANRSPQFSSANFPPTAQAGRLYSHTVTATDLDGDQVTYRLENQPNWLSITSSTGLISGTPSASDVGDSTNIRVIAMDGSSGEATTEFSVTVLAPETAEPPILIDDEDTESSGSGGSLRLPMLIVMLATAILRRWKRRTLA